MKTSPAELADQAALRADQTKERDRFSALCLQLLSMDDTKLRNAGYKSLDAALITAVKAHKQALNKLMNAFITKWPD